MGHGRPLGLAASSSPETPCSAPSKGNMALFAPSSLQKGDAGAYVKKSSLTLIALSPCAEAQGLLSGTIIRGTLKAPNSQLVTPIQKSATKASKRVLTLPSRLGGYCRGP